MKQFTICPNCGYGNNPSDALFCGVCGSSLTKDNDKYKHGRTIDEKTQSIAQHIIEILDHDFDSLSETGLIEISTPFRTLAIDSLDYHEFIMRLEEFNIEISDEDASTWNNIEDAADYIRISQ